MSSINSISPDKLARLIGVPHCPAVIDVRTDRDYEADPRFLPGALRRDPESVSEWASEFVGRPSIVIDQSGEQVSEGVAAWLRHAGASASDVLAGGHLAWVKLGGPLIPASKVSQRDAFGRTIWVTRSRPKLDRIACPWLIRRFLDPGAVFLLVAPYIEKIRANKALSGALAAITAAVVGVILNLAIWFGIHTIFRKTVAVDGYGLSFDSPVLASMDFWSLALSVAAAIAIFRLRVGMLQTLAGSCLAGIGLFLAGAI
jgi:rhodanese-related sulfurtransferase